MQRCGSQLTEPRDEHVQSVSSPESVHFVGKLPVAVLPPYPAVQLSTVFALTPSCSASHLRGLPIP